MPFDVRNKTALVTGANRGIGKAILETLLKHGASKVYAAVRKLDSAQPLVAEHGDKVVPIEVDYDRPETIAAAADAAADVHLVVNNAGILKTAAPLDAHAIETLEQELHVNVFGLMRAAQAFAPRLAENAADGGAAMVQLNSVASIRCFTPFATYCASKAASYSLTQALRESLAGRGVHVLSVHPGPIGTDMAEDAGFEDTDPPEVVAEAVIAALVKGDFHVFPDRMAKDVYRVYQAFAEQVVEAPMQEA